MYACVCNTLLVVTEMHSRKHQIALSNEQQE